MKTQTFRLSLFVTYDPKGTSVAALVDQLNAAAEFLPDMGMLSGELDAEVIECTHEVKVYDPKLDQTAAPESDGDQPITDAQRAAWPRDEWQTDVSNGDTKLGYEDWVRHNVESAAHDEI